MNIITITTVILSLIILFSIIYGFCEKDTRIPFKNQWDDRTKNELRDLLSKISFICRERNIPCVLIFGSLLGWARHDKKVIPWDDDLDICIPLKHKEEFINIIKNKPYLNLVEKNDSLKISMKEGYKKIRGVDCNWPFIDVFFYETSRKPTHYSIKFSTDVAKDYLLQTNFDTFKDTFEGVEMDVPKEYGLILDTQYGPNWDTECVSSSWDHKLEMVIDKRYIIKKKCSDVKI